MKTKEELNTLKEEVKTLNKKLAELTEEELAQVTGGAHDYNKVFYICHQCDKLTSMIYSSDIPWPSTIPCPECGCDASVTYKEVIRL